METRQLISEFQKLNTRLEKLDKTVSRIFSEGVCVYMADPKPLEHVLKDLGVKQL